MGLYLNTNKTHRIVSSFPPLLLLEEFFCVCDYSFGQQYYWVILKLLIITDFKTILGLMWKEFKACVRLQGYDVIGIAEM